MKKHDLIKIWRDELNWNTISLLLAKKKWPPNEWKTLPRAFRVIQNYPSYIISPSLPQVDANIGSEFPPNLN